MSILFGCGTYAATIFTGMLLGTESGPTGSFAFLAGAAVAMLTHWRRLRAKPQD
jgi:hypothetical protein